MNWNEIIFTHGITTSTILKSLKHNKMMECQQAVRLWKLNPVYEEYLIFSINLMKKKQNKKTNKKKQLLKKKSGKYKNLLISGVLYHDQN